VSGGWRLHGICLLVLAAQTGLWYAGHRSDRTLWQQTRSEDPQERIDALFLLLERGAFDPLWSELQLADQLLASSDPREAEFAHTTAVCKNAGADVQYRYLRERIEAGEVDAHFWRSFVLLRRKIGVVVGGSSGRLDRRELEWWLAARDGRPLPVDEVLEHIRTNP